MLSVLGDRPLATRRWVPSRINSAPSRTPWSFTCSPDSPSTRARYDSDALILAQLAQRLRNVTVFAMRQTIVSLDDGHHAAKTAHGLGQFKPDVAAAKDQEMPGNVIQLHGFDVREWPRLLQSRREMDGGAGPFVDHHVLADKCAHSSF